MPESEGIRINGDYETRVGTRRDDDIPLADGPYRDGLWEAISKNQQSVEIVRVDIKGLESAVVRFDKMSGGMAEDMRRIREILEGFDKKFIIFDNRITSTEKGVESLWKFPLKIVAVFSSLGLAAGMLYGFFRWLIPHLDVKYPR